MRIKLTSIFALALSRLSRGESSEVKKKKREKIKQTTKDSGEQIMICVEFMSWPCHVFVKHRKTQQHNECRVDPRRMDRTMDNFS
jgi:hypothetical protein